MIIDIWHLTNTIAIIIDIIYVDIKSTIKASSPALVVAEAIILLLDNLAVVVEVAQYTALCQLFNLV